MITPTQQQGRQLVERPMLTHLVRQALRRDDIEVVSSHVIELYGFGSGARIYRLTGEALAGATPTP